MEEQDTLPAFYNKAKILVSSGFQGIAKGFEAGTKHAGKRASGMLFQGLNA